MSTSFDYLVVGAGFAGATCAERLASAGKSVLIIDKRNHVGGNAYDEYNADGILIHKYGPHIFHTNSDDVFTYLSRFTTWRPYEHRVLSQTSKGLLPVPINRTTLAAFGGDLEAAKAEIYTAYTRKQWGCEPEELDPSVLARVIPRDTDDDRYFLDRHQMMPAMGFTPLIERMLEHPKIEVSLSHSGATSRLPSGILEGAINTGPIDEAFNYCFGRLPYRSAKFEHITIHAGSGQSVGVINYPSPNVSYTRVTEFKHLTGQIHKRTAICLETPTADGDPYWPMPTAVGKALYQQYKALAAETPGVHFLGRLGTYQYLNIDQAVAQALKLAGRLIHQEDSIHAH